MERGYLEDPSDVVMDELVREAAREHARERLGSDYDSDASHGALELDEGGDGDFEGADMLSE